MKLIIFGASGSGTTTLGRSLAARLNWRHLDADDYYWEKTNPPFQYKVSPDTRNENLKVDLNSGDHVIVSGSLVTWHAYWHRAFDLGVFLTLPHTIRMQRLRNREVERYGDKLNADPATKLNSIAFLEWASQYDDESFEGRSITQHRKWLQRLTCDVIVIDGDLPNHEREEIILKRIR